MGRLTLILVFFTLSCSLYLGAAQETSLDHARELVEKGSYSEAATAFNAILDRDPNNALAQDGLIRVYLETGRYADAEKIIETFRRGARGDAPSLLNALGDLKLETGRHEEAANLFESSGKSATGPALLRAWMGHARALLARGRDDDARPVLRNFISYYNSRNPTTAEELTLIARGLVSLEQYHDANDLFIDAREADPSHAEAYIGRGELWNQKYGYSFAASLFLDALKINPNRADSHLGLAESRRLESSNAAMAAVEKALAVNPNHQRALVLRAWMEVEQDRAGDALKTIDRVLEINPNSVQARAIRAAVFFIGDRRPEFDEETRLALSINPRAGHFYETLAHFAMINRRYFDSVRFGERAIELSPRLWTARTQLGIQLMRTGHLVDGRSRLEEAFEGDPFNVWAKNTLDLLDTMDEYRDTVRGPFLLKTAPGETEVLGVYAADLLEEAHRKLTERYRFTPREPISVEFFPNHDDFAVRALGLPGLGAYGVCFGQVIAMDSPSARPPGQFNWGSTLWHEYVHVITIQITDYRIPRWFSEGLSVYEERKARPGWGDQWSIDRLRAFLDGRFVRIDDLEGTFLRPRSPDQIPLAYFQSSLICDYIEERFGFEAILKMLRLYKEGLKTPEVFKNALGVSTNEFDDAFGADLRAKTEPFAAAIASRPSPGDEAPTRERLEAVVAARPNDFFARLRLGSLLRAEEKFDEALDHLSHAKRVFPFYGGDGNPYLQIADIHERRGARDQAASVLEELAGIADVGSDIWNRIARLKIDAGDRSGAVEALNRSFFVYPFDAALHKLAGDAYLQLGDPRPAVRAYQMVLALDPANRAQAHYDLALSFEASGNRPGARREVLRSLEIAPSYEKAQELLLRLRGNP